MQYIRKVSFPLLLSAIPIVLRLFYLLQSLLLLKLIEHILVLTLKTSET